MLSNPGRLGLAGLAALGCLLFISPESAHSVSLSYQLKHLFSLIIQSEVLTTFILLLSDICIFPRQKHSALQLHIQEKYSSRGPKSHNIY